jgi:hypothetical protein
MGSQTSWTCTPAAGRERLDEADHASAGFLDGHAFGADLDASGFDLGELEEALDELEEASGGGGDVAQVSAAFFELFGDRLAVDLEVACLGAGEVEEEFGEADDGVEGRAEFVGDIGEELALEAAGAVEGVVGLGEVVELDVHGGVHGAELGLLGLELVEHEVEGLGELLELVVGIDLASDIEVALADELGPSRGALGRDGG